MINISINDQEKNLIEISKIVEYQSEQIKKSLKENIFSKCLLDTARLLSLLKMSVLTPSNYYLLFNDISDIIQETIEYYIRDKTSKGIKIKYIYDSVQQSQFLIPRLYLMVITGTIYLELCPLYYREIIFDLKSMVKCVQNPLRAFWLRYFLYKNIKDKLPVKNGEYIDNEKYFADYFKISINFLMENLEYMNHYILRIRKEFFIDSQILDKKERENMIISEQEVIEEISNIKGLTKNFFENKILPKFIDIILDSENDYLIQQVLLETIIKQFKIDLYFDSNGISPILFTISRLIPNKEIDTIAIFINLLKNYKKFIKSMKKLDDKIKNEVIDKAKKNYNLFLLKYNELQIGYNNSGEKEFSKFADLDINFMKFTFKILLEKDEIRLKRINHIMDLCNKRIDLYKQGFNSNLIKKISSLIEIPLKKYSFYELQHFNKLIAYLDYNRRKEIGLKIIQSLTNIYNKDNYIDTTTKLQKLIELIFPLITEIKDENNESDFQSYLDENEKNINLCKMLSVFKSKKPEIMLDIYSKMKNFFMTASSQTEYYTVQSLFYYIINFIKQLELFFKYKFIKLSDNNADINNINEIINLFEIDDETDKEKMDEYFVKLMKDTIELLKECLLIIKKHSPEISFKLYLLSFKQMNNMNCYTEINEKLFLENFQYFFDEAVNIFNNYNSDFNNKYNLFIYLCGYLPQFTKIINKEKMKNIIENIENQMININDIKIKFKAITYICNLYYSIYKDNEKVLDYLKKSLLIAKNDLNTIDNINLLIELVNEVLYYAEKDDKSNYYINILNNIIKEIKDKEEILKNGNEDIYKYYKRTIDLINERKIMKKNDFYDSIII